MRQKEYTPKKPKDAKLEMGVAETTARTEGQIGNSLIHQTTIPSDITIEDFCATLRPQFISTASCHTHQTKGYTPSTGLLPRGIFCILIFFFYLFILFFFFLLILGFLTIPFLKGLSLQESNISQIFSLSQIYQIWQLVPQIELFSMLSYRFV